MKLAAATLTGVVRRAASAVAVTGASSLSAVERTVTAVFSLVKYKKFLIYIGRAYESASVLAASAAVLRGDRGERHAQRRRWPAARLAAHALPGADRPRARADGAVVRA